MPGRDTAWGPVPRSGHLGGLVWFPALWNFWPGPEDLWQSVCIVATAPHTPVETHSPPEGEKVIVLLSVTAKDYRDDARVTKMAVPY